MKILLIHGLTLLSLFISGLIYAAQDSPVEVTVRRLQSEAEQEIQRNQYDAGFNLLNQAYELTGTPETLFLRRDILNAIANVYYQTGQFEQAERYYADLLLLDEESQDQMALSVTLFNIGHVYASRFQFSAAEESFKRSRVISQELGDMSGEAFALKALGASAQARQDLNGARIYLNDALTLFNALENEVQVATVFRHLGDLESESANYDFAIENYLAALPVLTQYSMDTALLRTYRGLGNAYEKSFILDKALIANHAYIDLLQIQLAEQSKEGTQRLQVEFETKKFAEENTELEALNKDQQQELVHRKDLLKLQYVITALVSAFMLQLGYLWWKSRRYAKNMLELATRDELTDLFNRRAIIEHGKREWQRAERSQRGFCCLMLDIDHFKSINDTWGHAIGDEALRAVASVLSKSMRQTDSVGRFGGEEFIIFLSESDIEQAGLLAQRIRQNIMQIVLQSIPDKQITVSIGVAQKDAEESLDELIQYADLALYQAKDTGRNKVEFYSDDAKPELAHADIEPLVV